AGVEAGPDLDTEAPHGIADAFGATDGAGRSVEGREETVTGSADLTSTMALDLLADDRVMTVEEVAPDAVAERDRQIGRSDDVGKEDRREHAFHLDPHARAGQELLDF